MMDKFSRAGVPLEGGQVPQAAIDFSNARLDPHVVAGAGVQYVIRYLANPAWPKALSRGEAEGFLNAGVRVILNFEQAADQAKRGAAQGTHDARLANDYADAIGAPQSAEIYYSIDTHATYDEIAPYYRAARAVGRRPVSIYGPLQAGLRLQLEGVVHNVWVPNASSWSGFSNWAALARGTRLTRAAILQHLDHPLAGINPSAYDFNEVLGPVLAWGDPYKPDTPTPTKDDDMNHVVASPYPGTPTGRVAYAFLHEHDSFVYLANGARADGDEKTPLGYVWKYKSNFPVTGFAALPDGSGFVVTAADLGTFKGVFKKP